MAWVEVTGSWQLITTESEMMKACMRKGYEPNADATLLLASVSYTEKVYASLLNSNPNVELDVNSGEALVIHLAGKFKVSNPMVRGSIKLVTTDVTCDVIGEDITFQDLDFRSHLNQWIVIPRSKGRLTISFKWARLVEPGTIYGTSIFMWTQKTILT